MTTDTALRTDTPEEQAIHYPVTNSRRGHPLPTRAEWEITHRTVYSQDVSDVQDMVTTDLHAYGTEDEIQAAAEELETIWKATARQVRAANATARAIYAHFDGKKPPAGYIAICDAYDELTDEQKLTVEAARDLASARKHLHELAGKVRRGYFDVFAASRSAKLQMTGECPVYRQLASRYHAAWEKAGEDYEARITTRPIDDEAWAKELRGRERIEAYFRDGPVIHRRTITL